MSTLSCNGIDVTYVVTDTGVNNTQYKLTVIGFSGVSSSPVYNGQKNIKLMLDGMTVVNKRAEWPSRTRSSEIPEFLMMAALEAEQAFSNLAESDRSRTWTKLETSRTIYLSLTVFGLASQVPIEIPALPSEDPGVDSTIHVSPDSGYTFNLNYNVKTLQDQVIIDPKSVKLDRSAGKTDSVKYKFKIGSNETSSLYTLSSTNTTAISSGNSLTVNRSTKDKTVDVKIWAITNTQYNSDNKVYHDISATVSIPKKETTVKQYVTIKTVNSNKAYLVNQSAYSTYGRLEALVDFSDIDDPLKLLEYGQIYVNNMQFSEASITLSVADLHYLNSDIDILDLLDQVRCVSYPHGINRLFVVSEINIPLDNPSEIKYTLGKKAISGSMSTKMVQATSDFMDRINFMPNVGESLAVAQEELTETLNKRTTGYVNIVQENDVSQALVISDTPDWTQATALWKFDMNGLGFSDSTVAEANYSGPSSLDSDGRWYKYGLTMDGTIVANMIKTGILSDGLGYNYWNLATGEFRLSHNTIIDPTSSATIGDLYNTSLEALHIQSGNNNYLNGTDYYEFSSTGLYSQCKWKTSIAYAANSSLTAAQKKALIAVKKKGQIYNTASGQKCPTPNSNIKRAIIFKHNKNNTKAFAIQQANVELAPQTVYVVSFYFRSYYSDAPLPKLYVTLGTVTKKLSVEANKINKYTRYKLVFKTGDLSSDSNGVTSIGLDATSCVSIIKIKIDFSGVSYTNKRSADDYFLTGVMLNYGNVPADWCASYEDDRLHLYNYVDQVREGNLGWTTAQINAWANSMSQEMIFNRLTNNGQAQAIVMDNNGDLYINASYVRMSTLNAGIIKAGILSDVANKNYWNLVTGELKTNGLIAKNGTFYGSFKTVTTHVGQQKPTVLASGGTIKFYNATTYGGAVGLMDDDSTQCALTLSHPCGRIGLDTGVIRVRHTYKKTVTNYTRRNANSNWKMNSQTKTLESSTWQTGFTGMLYLCCSYIPKKNTEAYYGLKLKFINGLLVTVTAVSDTSATEPCGKSVTLPYYIQNAKNNKSYKHFKGTKNDVMPQDTDKVRGNTRTITKYRKIT